MDLTPEERKLIYQEELKKVNKLKMESLSEEERQRIFLEEADAIKAKEIVIDSSMITIPPKIPWWKDGFTYMGLLVVLILYVFFSFWGAFIGGFLFGSKRIKALLVGMEKVYPVVPFRCKFCQYRMVSRVDLKNPNSEICYKNSNSQVHNCNKCNRELINNYTYVGNEI